MWTWIKTHRYVCAYDKVSVWSTYIYTVHIHIYIYIIHIHITLYICAHAEVLRGFSSNRTFKWTSHMMMEQQTMVLAEPVVAGLGITYFPTRSTPPHVLAAQAVPPAPCLPAFCGRPRGSAFTAASAYSLAHHSASSTVFFCCRCPPTYHAWCHNNLRALLQQWPMMMFPFHREPKTQFGMSSCRIDHFAQRPKQRTCPGENMSRCTCMLQSPSHLTLSLALYPRTSLSTYLATWLPDYLTAQVLDYLSTHLPTCIITLHT